MHYHSKGGRLASWPLIVALLSAFSFFIVSGALASGSSVSTTATKLVGNHRQGAVVIVAQKKFGMFKHYFGLSQQTLVCWVPEASIPNIQKKYRVQESEVKIKRRGTFPLLKVYTDNVHGLRQLIEPEKARCAMVHIRHAFFLPIDPHTS